MALFRFGEFVSASGAVLLWKIECDALTDDDWDCIAAVCGPELQPFASVVGVPRGGERLARALERFQTGDGAVLVVDDVWTTGRSMAKFAGDMKWKGFVAFARGPLPPHVSCFAQIS